MLKFYFYSNNIIFEKIRDMYFKLDRIFFVMHYAALYCSLHNYKRAMIILKNSSAFKLEALGNFFLRPDFLYLGSSTEIATIK